MNFRKSDGNERGCEEKKVLFVPGSARLVPSPVDPSHSAQGQCGEQKAYGQGSKALKRIKFHIVYLLNSTRLRIPMLGDGRRAILKFGIIGVSHLWASSAWIESRNMELETAST